MKFDFNFKRVGQTHLFQSDSYIVTKEELKYIFANELVDGGDIQLMIDNHDMIPLETKRDRRVKYCFWPVEDSKDKWLVDIVKPEDGLLDLPERLIEILKEKEPVPMKNSDKDVEKKEITNSSDAKSKIWITYAWEDDEEQDVDYIAQELGNAGLEVKLDRWNIGAGKRLWEQIEYFIQDPSECDAWILFATPNSLSSEACKEEFSYALDRALNSRGAEFPIIGLFQSAVDRELIPAGIRTRLYVSTNDPNWKERIKAAAEGRDVDIKKTSLDPYVIKKHLAYDGKIIEVRPRAGEWYPFVAGFPMEEKNVIGEPFEVIPGPPSTPPNPKGGFIHNYLGKGGATNRNKKWWTLRPQESAKPSKSMYIVTLRFPSKLFFGALNGPNWIIGVDEIPFAK